MLHPFVIFRVLMDSGGDVGIKAFQDQAWRDFKAACLRAIQ